MFYLRLKILKFHFFNFLNKTGSLNINSSNSYAFHFVEIFRFEEIQSEDIDKISISSEGYGIFIINFESFIQNSIEIFSDPILKLWNICSSANRNYSLLHAIYKFPYMIWSLSLHWGYSLINEVIQWYFWTWSSDFF